MDFVFLPVLFYFALVLHFDAVKPAMAAEFRWLALSSALIAIPIFVTTGLYRAVIRYIDQKIITTVVSGTTLSIILLAEAAHFTVGEHLSASPFLIYWAIAILYVLASRFAARGYFVGRRNGSARMPVAIYGAGDGGSRLARALILGSEYSPIFFIDDNEQLQNVTVGGLRVYSPDQLSHLASLHGVNTVLLAIPSLTRAQQRAIIDRLADMRLQIKAIPPIASLLRGQAKVDDVRQIDIEDLLGRDQVAPDPKLLSVCITDKVVMVSGAGGSIGSELCRQIIELEPQRLVLLELSEFALYTIEQELQAIKASRGLAVEIVACLGSTLDSERCRGLMSTFRVHTVYHAAAYKHVPLVEHNPIEGIRNNVFGTLAFARAAKAARVKCFILVSTDKAVRPTNVMGATKRLAELILQALAHQNSGTRFSMVRFGNVLGSSGSVVPLFRKQIMAGGPVTLTHPEVTRYFMTIPEAAQLVLQAGAMGEGGDVFVLDMGEPVRIMDLATRMIRLSGQQVKSLANPNGTIELKFVGLRPGEKLYEELLIGASATRTEHPLIMRAHEDEIEWPFLDAMLRQLEEACQRNDLDAVRGYLVKLVSGYAPAGGIADRMWQAAQENAKSEQDDEFLADAAV